MHKANGLAAALQAEETKKSFWQKVNSKNIPITTNIDGRGKWWFRDC